MGKRYLQWGQSFDFSGSEEALRMMNHTPPRTMIYIIIIKQAQQAIRMFYGIYCIFYILTVHSNTQVHWCSLNHRLQLVLLAVLKWNTKEWKKNTKHRLSYCEIYVDWSLLLHICVFSSCYYYGDGGYLISIDNANTRSSGVTLVLYSVAVMCFS